MSELQSNKQRFLNYLPRFKKITTADMVDIYNNIDDYLEKCGSCNDLHFTDEAIAIMLKNSTWITKLGYKLRLVKF